MTNELTRNQHKKYNIKPRIPFLFIFTSIIFLLLSASALATPTILSDTGSDVYIKGTSNLLDDEDLTIKIYNVESGGSPIYSKLFPNAIQDGGWSVTLGSNETLDLDYMTYYYKEIYLGGQLVTFTDYLGQESTRTAFVSSFGYTTQLPGCSDGEIAKYNFNEEIWECSTDEDSTLPTCSADNILRYNAPLTNWDCVAETNELPICPEHKILSVISGSWDCDDSISDFSELADSTNVIPGDISDLTDNSNSIFSRSYTDLTNKPPIPSDVSNLTDNSNSIFSRSYDDLSNQPTIPADISQLTDNSDALIPDYNELINLPPNLDTNSSDDFSGIYQDLSGTPDFVNISEMETYVDSETSTFVNSAGVSSQILSEGFSGDYEDLNNTPESINQSEMEEFVVGKDFINISDLIGYATEEYVDTKQYSINWSNISGIPTGLTDGDNDTNTQLSQSEVSNFMNLEYPSLDTNGTDDLALGDVVNSIGNWSEDKTTYYNKSDIDGKDFINTSAIEDFTTELFVNNSIESINYSDINNLPAFTGWDTDESNDFDGNYTSLMDKPVFGDGFIDSSGTISLNLGGGLDLTHDGNLTLNLPEDSLLSLDPSSGELVYDNTTYLKNDGDYSTGDYLFDYVDSTFTVDSVDNRIGIGTKYPEYDLHIQTDTNSSLKYGFLLQNPNTTMGSSIGILFGMDSNVSYTKGAIVYERNNTHGRGDFHFLQEYNESSSPPDLNQAVLTIKNTGNVGIGDKSPVVKLDVDGVIRTAPRSSATCDTSTEGSIYYDSDTKLFFGCNSTTWVRFT